MINIVLKQGEGDKKDIVYISLDGGEEKVLSFEVIKEISKKLLDMKVNDQECDYTIDAPTVTNELYKKTINDVLKSTLEDEELIRVLKKIKEEKEESDSASSTE